MRQQRSSLIDDGVNKDRLCGLLFSLFLHGEGLFQEEYALDDGCDNSEGRYKVGQQVRIPTEYAVLGESSGVEPRGLCKETAHGGPDDATQGPDERLRCICFGCSR